MVDFFYNLNPVMQALLATIFTWFVTLLGAALVFFFKNVNKNIMDGMLGFSAGVMISASFWSLLSPAIDMATNLNMTPWAVVFLGFFSGGVLLFVGDKIFSYFDDKYKKKKEENIDKEKQNRMKRMLMLIFSITVHNIPEGLAVGIAFGSVFYGLEGATVTSALILALGIGIQNFPEGTAVSVPLRREGMSRKKAFFIGQLSGIVEPISGVLGALLVLKVRYVLPFFLSFAAGAMIYVVVQELIPASQSNEKKELMALFTLVGLSVMLILDFALG